MRQQKTIPDWYGQIKKFAERFSTDHGDVLRMKPISPKPRIEWSRSAFDGKQFSLEEIEPHPKARTQRNCSFVVSHGKQKGYQGPTNGLGGRLVRFFIPAAKNDTEASKVYDGIKRFVGGDAGVEFSDRKVQRLDWRHEGKDYQAEVGSATNFNQEIVIAILFDTFRKLYLICTPNRGVLRGEAILAGEWEVAGSIDFDGNDGRVI